MPTRNENNTQTQHTYHERKDHAHSVPPGLHHLLVVQNPKYPAHDHPICGQDEGHARCPAYLQPQPPEIGLEEREQGYAARRLAAEGRAGVAGRDRKSDLMGKLELVKGSGDTSGVIGVHKEVASVATGTVAVHAEVRDGVEEELGGIEIGRAGLAPQRGGEEGLRILRGPVVGHPPAVIREHEEVGEARQHAARRPVDAREDHPAMFIPFGLGQVAQEATDERAHVAV